MAIQKYPLLVKLFNGCPLQIHSTAAWTHPSTKGGHLGDPEEPGEEPGGKDRTLMGAQRHGQDIVLVLWVNGFTCMYTCLSHAHSVDRGQKRALYLLELELTGC
jgi:hypothetical protein